MKDEIKTAIEAGDLLKCVYIFPLSDTCHFVLDLSVDVCPQCTVRIIVSSTAGPRGQQFPLRIIVQITGNYRHSEETRHQVTSTYTSFVYMNLTRAD